MEYLIGIAISVWFFIIFPCMVINRLNKITESSERANQQIDHLTEHASSMSHNLSPLTAAQRDYELQQPAPQQEA